MKHTTFKADGQRRIVCPTCGRYLGDSHLGEKKIRNIRCKGCHAVSIVYPPRKDTEDDVKVIRFGPNEGVFTADLTEKEIEDSI